MTRVLHVVNYGWPYVDGYTTRSRSLISAQRTVLGLDTVVAVSPFGAFARAEDPDLRAPGWGPEQVPVPDRRPDSLLAGWAEHLERPTLGLAPLAEGGFARGLGEVVDRVRPDVVHAHHPAYVARAAHRVARERGIGFVYELRCFNGDYDLDTRNPYLLARGRRQNHLELDLCRRADHVVTIGTGLASRITSAGVHPASVTVVGNAVDTGIWRPRPRRTEPDVLRVGYATTFEAIEALDGLVEAAGQAKGPLAERGLRLEVVLAGAGRDWDRIHALVRERGLGETVRLPGFVALPALQDLYSTWDLFVVPRAPGSAATDTTPLKPLEAVAAGLPVLATDLPALRELLAGQPGVRHVAATPEGLARGLLDFADAPWRTPAEPDLGARTWARQVQGYRDVYAAVGVDV